MDLKMENNAHSPCLGINHFGKYVGNGAATQNINSTIDYSGTIQIEGKDYKVLFLVKVKKNKIRHCNYSEASDYWIVNGTNEEIIKLIILIFYNFIFFPLE